ncbi:MAG: thymidine kinase [Alphaproteobacteria bacterium]|nr:thymidine kinase [Alphaproteobacteria bacterium]
MAKIYFNYSAMNAGKSTILLQASHNYHERGMKTVLLTAFMDDRFGRGRISSRIGLAADAHTFDSDMDLRKFVGDMHQNEKVDCVLVDEAQFLSPAQVWQLTAIADELKIPIMCYGLRTDFQGNLFPGSSALLGVADDLREIKTICWCGRKATMNMRLGADGKPVDEGEQVMIGGEESYISVCRKHFKAKEQGATIKKSSSAA